VHELRQVIEVLIARAQDEIVLEDQRRQPHVICRDRCALFPKLAKKRRVMMRRLIVSEQHVHPVLQFSPPEILVHAVLVGERRLETFVGSPRSGDITEIPSFAGSAGHSCPFGQRGDRGFVQTFPFGARARKAWSIAGRMPRIVYCMH
jgi:hypothetical protein